MPLNEPGRGTTPGAGAKADFLRHGRWEKRLFFGALALAACAGQQTRGLPDRATATPFQAATSPAIAATPSAASTRTPTPVLSPTTSPAATDSAAVELVAVGDVMLARSIGDRILAEGPAAPFAGVAPALARADLFVLNLECALTDRGAPRPKAYSFRAPPSAADSLALAGADVVSLANNHALDYGPEGLADTLQLLAGRQIAAVGAGLSEAAARAPALLDRNGLRVAFLGYVDVPVEGATQFDTRSWIATTSSPGVAWADPAHISADVTAARAVAEVVVVMLHFGLEGRTGVTASQQAQAHAAIDAGAALVIGSHPHVLQGVELYRRGLILYSLGNFIFDGFGFPENYSAIFTATLSRNGVEAFDWIPVMVQNGLPRPATEAESPGILARVQRLP